MYLPDYEHDACGIGLIAHVKRQKSHELVGDALFMLENMEHRGGCGAEPETGDGAGILTEIPFDLLEAALKQEGKKPLAVGTFGVGMLFLPKPTWEECLAKFISLAEELGFAIYYQRQVPVDNRHIGPSARESEPKIVQVLIRHSNLQGSDLERKLYVLKKYASHQLIGEFEDFYISSLSTTKIIYKGQLRTNQLRIYYKDFENPEFKSCFAIIHSRFSTNTFPKWSLAQPFRYIAHNGEINTIRGNVNKMRGKEILLRSALFTDDELSKLLPICDAQLSDSANLDEVVELLVMGGRSLPHALMMLIPEAWQYNREMDENTRAFFKYSASIMEPWDGPAALCFTDGNIIGAALDRNGLRPCRYTITFDDRLIISSETGALPIDQKIVKEKGRLQPGKMLVVNLSNGEIQYDAQIKAEVVASQPYFQWVVKHRIKLRSLPGPFTDPEFLPLDRIEKLKLIHGYTKEDIHSILMPMALEGKEPIGSMGLEIPLASLSRFPQHPANYLKQTFAQVSNPPIDPIRERLVMSLFTRLGEGGNILIDEPDHCSQVHITRPVLRPSTFQKVLELDKHGFDHSFIDILFKKDETLLQGIDRICQDAEKAALSGRQILILSDRNADQYHLPIPSLLATGAIHHYLIDNKLRARTSLVIHAADIIEVHHYATLIGYGASAVMPYLVFNELRQYAEKTDTDFSTLSDNYVSAVGKGMLKIMSKMGISTLQSYQAAQIFEAFGMSTEVVQKCFKGTATRIGGNSFDHFEEDIRDNYARAYGQNATMRHGGLYSWRKNQEKHLIDPEMIQLLQKSTKLNDYKLYKKYADRLNHPDGQVFNLRNLLSFKKGKPIPLEQIEPVENILLRFATGAMSFGSISHEAHTTLAIAMNRIGGKSNSGEGGEDASRYQVMENGDSQRSRIKQVASGRFGVTSHYLNNADEIQIKIAQGAKPGEGGQLPGHKVDEWIARVRSSTPGVDLISPPLITIFIPLKI